MADIFKMLHLNEASFFFLSPKLRGQTRLINPILPNNVRRNDLHALVLFVKGAGAPRKGLHDSERRSFLTPDLISSQPGVIETCPQHLLGKQEREEVSHRWNSEFWTRGQSAVIRLSPDFLSPAQAARRLYWFRNGIPNALCWPWLVSLDSHTEVDTRMFATVARAEQVLGLIRTGQQKYLGFKNLTKATMQTLWLPASGWFYEPQCTQVSFANLFPAQSILFCALWPIFRLVF